MKENIRRYGAIECCDFIPGWFEDTLPRLDSPILLAFLDVDLEDSLATCVRSLWPHLVEGGYLFTDECLNPSYVSLFFSERWWKENLDTTPPGLIGGGTGLGLGTFYVGPHTDRQSHPLQYPGTGAYTQKSAMTGLWTYYPTPGRARRWRRTRCRGRAGPRVAGRETSTRVPAKNRSFRIPAQLPEVHELDVRRIRAESSFLRTDEHRPPPRPHQPGMAGKKRYGLAGGHVLGDMGDEDSLSRRRRRENGASAGSPPV